VAQAVQVAVVADNTALAGEVVLLQELLVQLRHQEPLAQVLLILEAEVVAAQAHHRMLEVLVLLYYEQDQM
jgi:hypothetical protein